MKPQLFLLCTLCVIVLVACAAPAPTATPVPPTPTGIPPTQVIPAADPSIAVMAKLYEEAKKEGALSTIALPDNWMNYGEMKKTFLAKFPGFQHNDLRPQVGSADEINAVKANKDNKGPQAPDTLDVGLAYATQLKDEKLCMLYKVANWDTIPNDLKDPDGCWYGEYYGVMSFAVNKTVIKNVPQDWADLLKPEYKNSIALAADPLTGNTAQQSIYAAALVNGGTFDNVAPGLEFFKKLATLGNLVTVIADETRFAKGETPIVITWDYLSLGMKDNLKGNPEVEVVVPKSLVFGGVYVAAISAYSPHPNAAKLWAEYLYTDEGQLTWLRGYGHPVRYNDMVKRNVIPADLARKLPSAELYAKALFPTISQLNAARTYVIDNWEKVVGVTIRR
jgi:putative spermidine/putrescine transport system substrate-binding protein